MPYVTRIERRAEERGAANGKRVLVIRLLNRKFGILSEETLNLVNSLSVEKVEFLGEALLDWRQVVDLEQWLAENEAVENF